MEARWRDGDQRHGESCKHGPAILILSNLIRARDLEASLEAQMTERAVAWSRKNDEERDRVCATSKYCAKI